VTNNHVHRQRINRRPLGHSCIDDRQAPETGTVSGVLFFLWLIAASDRKNGAIQ
jgi:hypothetical protein